MIRLILHAAPAPRASWGLCLFFFSLSLRAKHSSRGNILAPRCVVLISRQLIILAFSLSPKRRKREAGRRGVLLFSPLRTQSGGSFNLARTENMAVYFPHRQLHSRREDLCFRGLSLGSWRGKLGRFVLIFARIPSADKCALITKLKKSVLLTFYSGQWAYYLIFTFFSCILQPL